MKAVLILSLAAALVAGSISPSFADAQVDATLGRLGKEGGEWNARFSSNNCEVHYSQQGTRTQQTPGCNSTQIQKADTGMAATRREQGL